MCLLTLIPDYVNPDMERFKHAALANPDGFGFAISTGKKILTGHGMNFDEVANKFTDLRTTNQGPAIFHFRWATHGTETVDNCHPFVLGQDTGTVLGHNGILPVDIKPGDTRSDTKVFAQDIFPNLGGVTALDDNDYFVRLAAWAKGSKLAFLTVNDDAKYDWYIVNEADGHWDKEMWWSNHSYEERLYVPTTYRYGMYNSAWDYGYADYDAKPLVHIPSSDEDDYDDEAGILLDEAVQQMEVFMTQINDTTVLLECYTCAHSQHISADAVYSHCPACEACLFCGAHHDCGCWQAFDIYNIDYYNPHHQWAQPHNQNGIHPSYY